MEYEHKEIELDTNNFFIVTATYVMECKKIEHRNDFFETKTEVDVKNIAIAAKKIKKQFFKKYQRETSLFKIASDKNIWGSSQLSPHKS